MDTPVFSVSQARTDAYIHVGHDFWARRCEHCPKVMVGKGTGGAASRMALHVTRAHGEA